MRYPRSKTSKDDKADKVRSLAAKVIACQGTDVEVNLELLLKVWHDPAAPTTRSAPTWAKLLGNLERRQPQLTSAPSWPTPRTT